MGKYKLLTNNNPVRNNQYAIRNQYTMPNELNNEACICITEQNNETNDYINIQRITNRLIYIPNHWSFELQQFDLRNFSDLICLC